MKIIELSPEFINLVVVFEKLDIDLIRVDLIKKALGDNVKIYAFPDVCSIHFKEPKGVQVNFNNSHLSINIPVESGDTDFLSDENLYKIGSFFAETFPEVSNSVEDTKIIAYGYNINGKFKSDNILKYLLDVFCNGGRDLSDKIGAEVIKVAPGFSFYLDDALINIELKPSENDIVDFMCNIHYVYPPDYNNIREQFIRNVNHFKDLIFKM